MWDGGGTGKGGKGEERKFHMNSRLKAHANEVHHLGGCLVSFFFSSLLGGFRQELCGNVVHG